MRIMQSSPPKSPPFTTVLLILGAGLGIFLYASFTANPDYLGAAEEAMAFQVGAWTLALVMCVWLSPENDLRISNPAVLILGWSVLYFLYPTIFWLQGNVPQQIWVAKSFTTNSVVFLMWLHGLFILGFISGYFLFWNRSLVWQKPLNIKILPQGWLLYLVPFSLLILETLIRFGTTGEIFPNVTRGEAAYQGYVAVSQAKAQGGVQQIWTQIFHKIAFLPILIQGTGVGLILTHTIPSRRHLTRNLLILGGGFLLALFLGGGDRSDAIIPYIIGLIIADFLIGPISWRRLISVFAIVFLVFEFFGAFRNIRDLGFDKALYDSWESFTTVSLSQFELPEFLGMLGKEALGLEIFRSAEGLSYLVNSLLRLIPSQIFPGKLAIPITSNVLGQEILGIGFDQGMGVAGAMIVDGWRFYGTVGVPLLAALIGVFYALAQNWLSKDTKAGLQGPVLLKLVLIAGFFGYSFHSLRSDLFSYLFWFFYYIFLPWIVCNYILRGRKTIWSVPIPPIKSDKRRIQVAPGSMVYTKKAS